nr:hypothetical protein [uncultured Carboxylicivirga sp.]
MVSRLRPFLAEKAQNGELTEEFYNAVGISSQRIEAFLFGRCGATIKEINNVAKYFKVPSSTILIREAPKLFTTKTCAHCQEEFIPGNARQEYCSDKCRNRAFRANLK